MNMLKESQIKEEIIIKFFMENPTFFISEISREISIPKSTIQRYLKKNENLLIESENRTIKEQLAINKNTGKVKGGLNSFKNNDVIKDENGKFVGSTKSVNPGDKEEEKLNDIKLICTFYLEKPTFTIKEISNYFCDLNMYIEDYVYDCLTNSRVANVMGKEAAKKIREQLERNRYTFLRKIGSEEIGIILELANLTDIEKEIISLRIENNISLEKIGELFSLSKTSIMKIENRALDKIINAKKEINNVK